MSNNNNDLYREGAHFCALDSVPSSYSNKMFAQMLNAAHTCLAEELYPAFATFLRDHYHKYGIASTINECKQFSEAVIQSYSAGSDGYDLGSEAIGMLFHGQGHIAADALEVCGRTPEEFRDIIEVLRFPKRFGYPTGSSLIEASSLGKVKGLNDRHYDTLRTFTRGSGSPCHHFPKKWVATDGHNTWWSVPAYALDDYLDTYGLDGLNLSEYQKNLLSLAGQFYEDAIAYVITHLQITTDCGFTAGSTYEKCKLLSDKVTTLSKTRANLGNDPMYPIGDARDIPYRKTHAARMVCVPKDAFNYRVVAPEPCATNYAGTAFRKAYERLFDKVYPVIPYDNQAIQHEHVSEGTLRHWWGGHGQCSIDLSGASDSIPAWQIHAASPIAFNVLKELRASTLEWPDGTTTKSHIFFTSGNAITWHNESIWFSCIVLTGIIFHEYWVGKRKTLNIRSNFITACNKYAKYFSCYGDDIIIDSQYYDTVVSVLTMLGYTVNETKSYDGYYAESCGVDMLSGVDVTTVYWPRRIMEWNPRQSWRNGKNAETVLSLVSLQHHLYSRYPKTAALIEKFVLDLAPSMTYSRPGDESQDLWGLRLTDLAPAPNGEFVDGQIRAVIKRDQLTAHAHGVCWTREQAATRSLHYTTRNRVPQANRAQVANEDTSSLDMYLYYSWLCARDRNPIPNSDIPAFIWINGIRQPACIMSYRDALTLRVEGETAWVLARD